MYTYYMYLHNANTVTLSKVIFLFYTEIMKSYKRSVEINRKSVLTFPLS